MKVLISLPDLVFSEAEQLAKRLQISRSQLYASALAEYLERHVGLTVTERLNAVYSVLPSTIEPALMTVQKRAIDLERW